MIIAEAIKTRRAVKKFDPDHLMKPEEIEQIMSLAILSPTAFNIQHWRFVLAEDKALRKDLSAAAWNQPQVTDASLFILVTADLRAWDKSPERYWDHVDEPTRKMMLGAIHNFYADKPATQRDEAIRSGAMAASNIMLVAKSLGYDSCPMTGFDAEATGKLIKLPEDHIIVMAVAIGKAIEPARERGGRLTLDDVVIKDHF